MKLQTQGISLAYETAGPRNSLPVVFIHGFPFSREMWRGQVKALSRDFYVVTYDVRGHGESDTGDGQYTVELFVDDLIALFDHLKLKRAAVVGLSMGGYIALRAAERHPDRFRALVLCDTRSEADGNEGKIKRAQQVREIKNGGLKDFTEQFLRAVFYEKSISSDLPAVASIKSIIEKTPPQAVAGTLIALAGRTDTSAALYKLNIPTLILVGRHDAITPPSAANAMKEKISGSEMHIIPDAGHMSNLENPAEFTGHLVKFLHTLKESSS